MRKEYKVLLYSMINNFIIALMKIVGGMVYGLSSLIADGIQTISDFITDIVCLIASKVSKKKPTKYHPFGFGKVEYLTNLFVGILLFFIGLFILVGSFFEKTKTPPISLMYLLLVTFLLKLIAILVMQKVGQKTHSQLLITAVEESKTDLYSTIGVMLITIILQFSSKLKILAYSDIIGSIIISIIVLKTALKIIIDNSLSLIGEIEEDEEYQKKLNELLDSNKKIHNYKYQIIKYGAYYKLQLTVELDSSLSLRQVSNLENAIKTDIVRHRSLKIKYVTIYATNKIK